MKNILDKVLPNEYAIGMLAKRYSINILYLRVGSSRNDYASQASTDDSTERLGNRKVIRPFSFGRMKLCLEQREHIPAKITRQQSPTLKEMANACHRGNNAGKRSDVKQLAWTAKMGTQGA